MHNNFLIESEKLLLEGEIGVLLNFLLKFDAPFLSSYKKDITHQLIRWNRLQKRIDKGIVNSEYFTVEEAKISDAVENLLYTLHKKLILPSIIKSESQNKTLEKIIGKNKIMPIQWLSQGLSKAKSVCRIAYKKTNFPIGTGFLLENGVAIIEGLESIDYWGWIGCFL